MAKPTVAAGTNDHPTNNEKRKTQSPTKSTETRTISARTHSTQTPRRSGDEQFAPDTSCLYPYKPAAANISPPQRISPG